MCLVDDAERVSFCLDRRRKARKEHRCSECSRTIERGEFYTYFTLGLDGRVENNKRCNHCDVSAKWLERHCGGWVFGSIKEEIEEHYDSGYREDGLQRLVIGIRRKWAAFSGDGLLPLETNAEN